MIRKECNPSCLVVQNPVMGNVYSHAILLAISMYEIALASSDKILFSKLYIHFIE
jgi:hypothetical protein